MGESRFRLVRKRRNKESTDDIFSDSETQFGSPFLHCIDTVDTMVIFKISVF